VAFRSAFEQFLGYRWADEEIKALFGPTEEGSCRQAVPDNWKGCLEAYLDAYERAHTELTEPFPGIEAALRLLKERGVATALLTGKGPASTHISLEYLGLEPYFELVETGSPDGPIKPKSLKKVLAEWDMDPHEAAYVGDSAYDVEAAAEVGMITLGAAWAEDSTVHGAHPTKLEAIFCDVSDFVRWIETNVPKVKPRPPDSS
jgi:pyrophosphatase PpaX